MLKKVKDWDEQMLRFGPYRILSEIPRKILRGIRWLRNHGLTCAGFYVWQKLRVRLPAKEPLVSIVVPVYNVEPYLEQCLDSLVKQTMKAIEIIAVDDGSTDGSLEILNRYAAQDKRVHVYTQKNQYAGAARNLGLSHAKGEYVLFLDGDDHFAKNLAADTYVEGKAAKADLVLFDARQFDDQTGRIDEQNRFCFEHNIPRKQPFNYQDCPEKLFQITTPCPWTKLFRREFIQEQGLRFQCIHNSNDVYFTLSAMASAERIVSLNKTLVYYRTGLSGNLQSTKSKNPFCFYEAYRELRDRLVQLGRMEELRQSFVNRVVSECLFNIRTQKDVQAQKAVYELVRQKAVSELELAGYEKSFYYNPYEYKVLRAIMDQDSIVTLREDGTLQI